MAARGSIQRRHKLECLQDQVDQYRETFAAVRAKYSPENIDFIMRLPYITLNPQSPALLSKVPE